MLRYTGNAILPFRWERISSTRKTEAQFASLEFDKFVTSVGTTGLIACNGASVDRFDMSIPDFARGLNADKFRNFFAYKFEEVEHAVYTYAANDRENVDKALIHHFEDNGFTTYDIRNVSQVTAITEADPGVVTTDKAHGLTNGDRISFQNVGGMTELNDNIYVVAGVTDTTFQLQGVDTSSGFTTYTSGGEVIKGHAYSCLGEWVRAADDVTWADVDEEWDEYERVWNDGRFQIGAAIPIMGDAAGEIWELNRGGADRAVDTGSDVSGFDFKSTLKTKRFSPFVEDGVNAELGYVDILFSTDSNATVDVEFFLDAEGQPYKINDQTKISYDLTRDRGSDQRIWKRIYVGATGNSHEMQLTTEGQEKYVDIHAMIFWFRPAGRLSLHA
jgi:hypothetical protein